MNCRAVFVDPIIASTWHNMARVNACLGQNMDALECLREALLLRQKYYGPGHDVVRMTRRALVKLESSLEQRGVRESQAEEAATLHDRDEEIIYCDVSEEDQQQ
jgi:hypothetical protein